MSLEHQQRQAEQLIASKASNSLDGLMEALAFKAAHWSRNLVVRPGMRVATPVGIPVEVVCRLPASMEWKLRRPANSRTELRELGKFEPDVGGLYRVTVSIFGFERSLEVVAFPDSIVALVQDGGGMCDRVLVLQSLVNDSSCTATTIIRCLETDAPTLRGILGEQPVSLKNYGSC